MTNKLQLSSIALLLGGIALTGCAPKQAWSPELEQAREAYQKAASDPQVVSLAVAELKQAKEQLQVAENAADYFKSRDAIAHESTLATLKSQEAEQTARALQAKENIRLAEAGSLPTGVLPGALPDPLNEPMMAAAAPGYGQQHHSAVGSMAGPATTEEQQIAQQIAALSAQIAQLQTRVAGSALQSSVSSYQQPTALWEDPRTIVSLDEIEFSEEIEVRRGNASNYGEPVLGAARPALDGSSDLQSATLIEPAYNAPRANVPDVVSSAQLRDELRAMNARPTENGMTLTLGERYFESGSARLWTGRAARHLDNIASVMVENQGLVIDIEAHTDNQGSAEQNNNLTADRATAIKSALVLRGVDGKRVNTTGLGDSAPIADNNSSLGRLQNRRVEIIFPNVTAM